MKNLKTTYTPTTLTVWRRDTTEAMPTASEDSMPTLTDENAYTTPSVTVPPSSDNPYLLQTSNVNGTVFIAVGGIVGAILLAFIIYHLIRSVKASRLAKKTLASEKHMYEKYQNNNSTAYGLTPSSSTYMVNEHQLVSRLPLLSHHPSKSILSGLGASGSQVGDTSTITASEPDFAQKHDMTRMFISPTADAMHKRVRSSVYGGLGPSMPSLLAGGSTTNLANPQPATNRHSQLIPSLYVNSEANNSDYGLNVPGRSNVGSPRQGASGARKPIPSMYLEDLIDKKESE